MDPTPPETDTDAATLADCERRAIEIYYAAPLEVLAGELRGKLIKEFGEEVVSRMLANGIGNNGPPNTYYPDLRCLPQPNAEVRVCLYELGGKNPHNALVRLAKGLSEAMGVRVNWQCILNLDPTSPNYNPDRMWGKFVIYK